MSLRLGGPAGTPAPAALPASTTRVDAWWLPADDEATARAALRALLGRHLGVPQGSVVLRTTARGKPFLDPGHGVDLRFSLAHSGGRALAALRLGHDVGADLERIRPDVDCRAVAATVFPAAMRIAWHAVLAAGRRDAFFDAWVRFEALAKAGGRGIADSEPLGDGSRFTCRALPAPAGFAAAVASEGSQWTLVSRTAEPAAGVAAWR